MTSLVATSRVTGMQVNGIAPVRIRVIVKFLGTRRLF